MRHREIAFVTIPLGLALFILSARFTQSPVGPPRMQALELHGNTLRALGVSPLRPTPLVELGAPEIISASESKHG